MIETSVMKELKYFETSALVSSITKLLNFHACQKDPSRNFGHASLLKAHLSLQISDLFVTTGASDSSKFRIF